MNATDKKCNRCFFGTCIDKERYKCHVSRPTANIGFPKVNASDYCSYWTDPETMDRPFFYLLPNDSRVWGVTKDSQPIAKEDNDENRLQDDAGGV